MMVTFPIAFLMGALGTDLFYWVTADPFWPRVSLWLIGAGTVMGIAAGIAGTIELFIVPRIRQRSASWDHFIAAVMLLSVGFANWMLRIGDAEGTVLPWGMYLSALGALLVAFAGWLGGHLVFKHHIGIHDEEDE